MTWLTRDWLNPNDSAGRPKCSSSARTRNVRISRSSTDSHIPERRLLRRYGGYRARSAAAGPRAQPCQQAAAMRPDATPTVLVEGLPGGHVAVHVLEAGGGHRESDHLQLPRDGGHRPVRGRVEPLRPSAPETCLRGAQAQRRLGRVGPIGGGAIDRVRRRARPLAPLLEGAGGLVGGVAPAEQQLVDWEGQLGLGLSDGSEYELVRVVEVLQQLLEVLCAHLILRSYLRRERGSVSRSCGDVTSACAAASRGRPRSRAPRPR